MQQLHFSSQEFQVKLATWFQHNQRQLPWRSTNDPYRIWISEAMLQQTQVVKVLEYYQRFISRFPTISDLAQADLAEVLKMWEGMGYYARARNLHKAAQAVISETNGIIPADYEAFKKLPGVGDYIAAAVLSIAHNAPFAVMDGNVKRVLARLFLIDSPLNESKAAKVYKSHAEALLDADNAGTHNQAMMELGAIICRPQQPLCTDCPVSEFCKAYSSKQQHFYPVKPASRKTPQHHIAVGIIHRENKFLIVRRPLNGLLGGLWEFPGGKVDASQNIEDQLISLIRLKTNLKIEITRMLTQIKHAYSHFRIIMDVYHCNFRHGQIELAGHVDYRWITAEEIDEFAFHVANHKFFHLLK
ncbi:A/G-specific adenine glycosylase [candidate division KSB1 bacterium]|nr:A/G-specific adenine glycosylase [candidate division KSB1 bacterium]